MSVILSLELSVKLLDILIFSMPEPKALGCIQSGGESKTLMRNDSGISNTSAKQYYLRQSRYLPGKGKIFVTENTSFEVTICDTFYLCSFDLIISPCIE